MIRFVVFLVISTLLSSAVFAKRGNNYSRYYGVDFSEIKLDNGEFFGEADGFRRGLVVRVVVEDRRVKTIEIVEHNEIGRQYWQFPMDVIPPEIIKRQSTDITTVSGATATSCAILSAVERALLGEMEN